MDLDHEQVKDFTKNVLGCQCPDDIFKEILIEYRMTLEPNLIIDQILTIGNRLLIFLVKIDNNEINFIKGILPKLIVFGKTWRDKKNLNRFRLVILTNDRVGIFDILNEFFTDQIGNDDKIHLHILDSNILSNIAYEFLSEL